MSYQDREKRRLADLARERWRISGHVIPYELARGTLHEDICETALAYFGRHEIKWWTSRWDKRTKEMAPLPTGHLNSSQVACINHLEPARTDIVVAEQLLANVAAGLRPATVDDGFVDYEWIGYAGYLGERGPRVRGANITSLDAVMCGERGNSRILVTVEWKYLESYSTESVATSRRGTDRIATYRPLLEQPDCPIAVSDIACLFYEPYYQLMRQTLLAWQMVKHKEFGATDWLHVHVVPEENAALRRNAASPQLVGDSMAQKWRSTLREPQRYLLMTPTELLAGVGESGHWSNWRRWLHERYLT
jgi:hypothetical protein